MELWQKLKFQKLFEIRNRIFMSWFSMSKCHLSPRIGIVRNKLVYFLITLIVSKLSPSSSKCYTMNLCPKLKFQKLLEFRNRTFMGWFSMSKCCLSPWFGFIRKKLVFFEILLIVSKLSLSSSMCSTMDLWPKPKFPNISKLEIKLLGVDVVC